MVLRLSGALGVPLRQQNSLLLAAGYAPHWDEGPLGEGEHVRIERGIGFMLMQQEPFPAFVVDRRWNLLKGNRGAGRLVGLLTGSATMAPNKINLADALVAPDGLRPHIVNWEEVVLQFVRSVQADAAVDGNRDTSDLLRRLLSYPDVSMLAQARWQDASPEPVLNIHFCKDGISLQMFTMIATLGTPQSVTAQEIRVEMFFPANGGTEAFFRG
jgi:hypothetical protein